MPSAASKSRNIGLPANGKSICRLSIRRMMARSDAATGPDMFAVNGSLAFADIDQGRSGAGLAVSAKARNLFDELTCPHRVDGVDC